MSGDGASGGRARALAYGLWEFVVGDDWRTALGVAVALAATATLAGGGVAAWWVMPAVVLALLWTSVRRAAAQRKRSG